MAYTLNRRLAELIDSNGQLASGKIATGYISTAHFASNSITDAKLHSSFALPASALSGRDTGDLSEGVNQYFTNARADARFDSKLAGANTGALSEGSNLYYTDARVANKLATSVGNIITTGYIAGPATFTIDPAAVGDNTGTVVIAGNLQVDGTTTTINSTTVSIDDLNFTIASDAADSSAANGAGITIGGASATMLYTHATTSFDFNKPITSTGLLTIPQLAITSASTADTVTLTRGTNGQNNMLKFVTAGTDDWIVGQRNNNTSNFHIYSYGTSANVLSIARSNGAATFAGTISSGAITSSSTITANGLTVNTGALRLASLDTSVNDTESIGDIEFYSSDASTGGTGVQSKISALSDSAYGVSYALSFATGSGASPTEKMRITNLGTVLVGKTSETTATDGIELNRQDVIVATRNNDSPLILNRRTSDGDIAVFRKDNTVIGSIGVVASNNLYIHGDTVGLGIGDDNLYPTNSAGNSTSGALDIGDSSAKFRNLHLSGTISSGAITSSGNITAGNNGNINIPTASSGNANLSFDGSNFTIVSNSSSANLKLQTNSQDTITIGANGNLTHHRGTATFGRIQPNEHIIFQSATGYLQFPGASSRAWALASQGGTAAPGTNSATFGFHHWSGSAWTNPINITASGKLGIGTDNPTYPLDVTTASGHSYIRTISTASNTRAALLTTGEDSSGNAVNGYFGSVGDANEIEIASLTNHQIKMYVNNTPAKGVIINTDGNFLPQQDVEILDNKKLKVGSGGDLQIYHDASNSYIKSSTGWLNMPTGGNGVSIANSDFSEQIARFLVNGACELYYNGEKTLETTATGINVFDTGGTPYIDLKTGSTLQGRIYADTNQMIIDANNSTTIQMKHAGVMQAAFNTNVNSSGDGGLAITSGKRLGFDESGTRSWTVKATGGNLQVFSGDGGGSFYISMSTYLANTLQQALPSTGLAHTQAGWGRTFYMSMDWSGVARTLTLHTNSSYFQAKVTVATQQSNGGSDNNRWVEGIWSNNHTTHLWKEFVDEGFTGQNETYTVGVGDSASNSGKLVIARAYQANASGTFRVKVENVGYVGSMTYAIT